MPRIAYVNGQYVPHNEAAVHIEDRGYQFADAVYEVTAVVGGKLLDNAPHMVRLHRSLNELHMESPMGDKAMEMVMGELLRRNRVRDGFVYIQISRGVAPRDHAFPTTPVTPALVMTVKRVNYKALAAKQDQGVKTITVDESRWNRPDIKSVSLLPNALAKQLAKEAGAHEAIFVKADGTVTEGTSSNAWIINKQGQLQTHDLGRSVLPGITRGSIIAIARQAGVEILEKSFSKDELLTASEAFISSTTNFMMPVVGVDGQKIGAGTPGPVAKVLVKAYRAYIESETGVVL
ncbi:MAG: D-amino-acid transaminase [Sphingomonadales bacterium]|nr:D-amino-acid transaminase [Sphingomonadales bacterium]